MGAARHVVITSHLYYTLFVNQVGGFAIHENIEKSADLFDLRTNRYNLRKFMKKVM